LPIWCRLTIKSIIFNKISNLPKIRKVGSKNSINRITNGGSFDSDLVYLFKEALNKIKDIDVLAFSDPKLALEHFQGNSDYYLAVITDYRMPQMNGLELLNKIRDVNPRGRRILISAFEIQDDLFQGFDYVDRFLQKPISMVDLINEVENLVTKTNAVE
jgi:response regulator RpfG family c-di-GMP phosphodiesterase